MATLPLLLPNEPPAVSMEWFLGCAQRYLSSSDWALLTALAEDRPHRNGLVAGWRRHETQLRNAVARHRAARIESDPGPWIRTHEGYDVTLERAVAQAFQAANPLQRERLLDAQRWRRAEELAGFDPFAVEAVLAYFLKLRIVERMARRDPDAGRARRADFLGGLLSPEGPAGSKQPAAEGATAP